MGAPQLTRWASMRPRLRQFLPAKQSDWSNPLATFGRLTVRDTPEIVLGDGFFSLKLMDHRKWMPQDCKESIRRSSLKTDRMDALR